MTDDRFDAARDRARPTFERRRADRTARRSGGHGSGRPGGAARSAKVPFAVLLGSLVLGGMALLLVLNTASAANELDRQRFAAADQSVAASVAQLRNEVAASAAPGNLASAAAQLGMVPAGNPAFLVLGADGSVTVSGSAAPAAQVQVEVPKAPRHRATPSTTATSTTTAPAGAPTTRPSGTSTPTAKGTAPTSASPPSTPTKTTGAPAAPTVTTITGGAR